MKKTDKPKITLREKIRVLFRLLSFAGKYSWLLYTALILAFVYSLFSYYVPVAVGEAVNIISDEGAGGFDAVLKALKYLPLLIACGAVSDLLLRLVSYRGGACIIRNIRRAAFEKLQKLPLSAVDREGSGNILSRIVNDTDRLSDCLLTGLVSLYASVFGILITLIGMLIMSPVVGLAVALLTPLSMLLAGFITGRTFEFFKKSARISAKQTALSEEAVTGCTEIRIFQNAELCIGQFGEVNREYRKTATKAVLFSSLTNPTTRFVNSMVYCCVILIGGLSVLSGSINLGQYVTLMTFSRDYAKPFNDLSGVLAEAQNALASAMRVFELLDTAEEIPDAEDAHVLSPEEKHGLITARNLEFSYTDRPFMQNLNFTAEPGQKIAIVGPTGCGKTTLVNLLMRFYRKNGGSLEISGTDVNDINCMSLRSSVGMVLQDTWISSGTVADNIRIGKPSASMDEVIDAAKKSHAHSFISRLPEGYNTLIGDSGEMLSAGERQLLCISRVMLALPPVLILDEATSSIDTRTEMKIQAAFAELMKGRTTFIVAHRLNTIKNADRILVMNHGIIEEQGTHSELIAAGGFYASLYGAQFE